MPIQAQEIIEQARQWLGTPFAHQARLKGVGCDCVGLIVEAPKGLICDPKFDTKDYTRAPNPRLMGDYLDAHLDRVEIADMQVADILWLKIEGITRHLALVSMVTPTVRIIHAWEHPGIKKVVESTLGEYWRSRIYRVYRYREG